MRPRHNFRARRRLAAFAGVLALGAALSGCIGYDGDFDRGYQVDQQALDQVKVGATTKPQALALMGTPSTTSTVGGDAWYYIGQKMSRALAFMPAKMTDQNVLAIYFDKSGKVDAHRQLRHAGRQGVRFRFAHDADRRAGAGLPAQHHDRTVPLRLTGGGCDAPRRRGRWPRAIEASLDLANEAPAAGRDQRSRLQSASSIDEFANRRRRF